MNAKIVGGCRHGLNGSQATAAKMQFGTEMNRLLTCEYRLSAPSLDQKV